jgi:hypothetical protein
MYRGFRIGVTLVALSCVGLPVSALGQNIAINGDFENGIASWNTWTGYGTLSAESSNVHGGNGALKIVGGGGGAQAYQYITLDAGEEYSLTGWIFIPDSSVTGAFLDIYSSGCGDYLFERVYINGPTIGWQKFGPSVFTAPACATNPYVQLGGFGNGGTVYWDDVTLVETGPGATNAVTTDWYTIFINYANFLGTWHSSNLDGGILAWGESYLQNVAMNLYASHQDTQWLDLMVSHVDQMIANMSDVPLFSPYDPQYVDGYAAWGQNRFNQYTPNYTEWLSSHGNIIGPIMRFVEAVYDDPALHAAYKAKADQYLAAIEANIILLWYNNWDPDPGWIVGGDNSQYQSNSGYHVYEWSGWLNQPFNMHLCFTDALVTLRRISTSPLYTPANPALPAWYVSQTDAMLQNFKSWMMYDAGNNLYTWLYGPHSAWPILLEDVGHAFLDIQAAVQGFKTGIEFTATDLQRMANCFVVNVWNGSLTNPGFHYYIDGVPHPTWDSPNGSIPQGHWGWGFLYLAGYDYRIWESMAAYFDQHIDPQQESSGVAVTTGMLAYAAMLFDVYPPGEVENLMVSQGGGNDVEMSWQIPLLDADATALTEVAGYNVYKSTKGQGGPYLLVNPLLIEIDGAVDQNEWGVGNWYEVRAVDYAGNEGPATPVLAGAMASDFNNSGNVDMADLLFQASQWLSPAPQNHPSTGKSPDLVPGNGVENSDFSFFADEWNSQP